VLGAKPGGLQQRDLPDKIWYHKAFSANPLSVAWPVTQVAACPCFEPLI